MNEWSTLYSFVQQIIFKRFVYLREGMGDGGWWQMRRERKKPTPR